MNGNNLSGRLKLPEARGVSRKIVDRKDVRMGEQNQFRRQYFDTLVIENAIAYMSIAISDGIENKN
nr:hypothetical protein Iba_chr02cCG7160 [Ipomoea batatas]